MLNQKQRQRAKRKEKRQVKAQLKTQASRNQTNTPIGVFAKLNCSFVEFACGDRELVFDEIESKFRNRKISTERQALVNKAIALQNKINPQERRVQK
ncbi:MAG: hypothetical protein GX800_01255 [Clostridiaceae bacterium]|nr:hypothetical protein [Clostridiaceae bacterium]